MVTNHTRNRSQRVHIGVDREGIGSYQTHRTSHPTDCVALLIDAEPTMRDRLSAPVVIHEPRQTFHLVSCLMHLLAGGVCRLLPYSCGRYARRQDSGTCYRMSGLCVCVSERAHTCAHTQQHHTRSPRMSHHRATLFLCEGAMMIPSHLCHILS